MPELPEVEVTRLGIAPFVEGKNLTNLVVHEHKLRWPIPKNIKNILLDQKCIQLRRRGKYLLFEFDHGTMLIHLGMTGVLRVQKVHEEPQKYHRIEFQFQDRVIRLHDPRKFGAVLWHPLYDGPIEEYSLLKKLGVEPLENEFAGKAGGIRLFQRSRGRTLSIKQYLLAGEAVVGVGNIYCSESLFTAGINPKTPAGKISLARYQVLAESIRLTLIKAIQAGGSSLKDFVDSKGEPGHFMMQTMVYDRAGEPCKVCGQLIKQITQGQRSTYYCSSCQH